jgi:hypothetical protein
MMAGDESYDDDVTSGLDDDCGHLRIYWGDGLQDPETGIVEDPDYLGVCQVCGAWMARDGERTWTV